MAGSYRYARIPTSAPLDPFSFKLTQEDRELLEEIEGMGSALARERISREEADRTKEDEADVEVMGALRELKLMPRTFMKN